MIIHHNSRSVTPSRVVVLGASGFVGQHMSQKLRDHNIPMLTLSSDDVDLCDPSCIRRLKRVVKSDDTLLFVSALTPDKGKGINTLMSNLKMGEHVSLFLEQAICSHVVYISSDAVYADNANPVLETSCCDPSSFHGLMHMARERMLTHVLLHAETPLLCLRPCAMYGIDDTHNGYGPNRFLSTAFREGQITLFGNGEEKRDHLYIDDFSHLVLQCILHRSSGVLNVASGHAVSFHNIAEKISVMCDHQVQINPLPRTNAITHRHFDITSAIKAFPDLKYTQLADGIAATIAGTAAFGG